MKSDFSYSPGLVYNTFPWPDLTDDDEARLDGLAQAILDSRAHHSGATLADLYDPNVMPDPARAARLYRAAARFASGTNFIYVPGVKGQRGYVMPIRNGPDQPGLPEAMYRLGQMYLDGRGLKQDVKKGRELLWAAERANYRPVGN